MPINPKNIRGISAAAARRLQTAGVGDDAALRAATRMGDDRRALAVKVGQRAADVYLWAKQADLLRVEGVGPDEAQLLIQCGIRCAPDLAAADGAVLTRLLKTIAANTSGIAGAPSGDAVERWRAAAASLPAALALEEDDELNPLLAKAAGIGASAGAAGSGASAGEARSASGAEAGNAAAAGGFSARAVTRGTAASSLSEAPFFNELGDLLTQLGTGIASAQHQMDLASMDIQNRILADEELAASGFNATWYAIPEVNFSLKMEYAVMEETSTSGSSTGGIRKLFISPSNAKYNNLFKSSQSGESALSLRIVPVPAPDRMTGRVLMPDLVGLTREAAEAALADVEIAAKEVLLVQGATTNGKATEVTAQSIAAGKLLLIGERPTLTVTVAGA